MKAALFSLMVLCLVFGCQAEHTIDGADADKCPVTDLKPCWDAIVKKPPASPTKDCCDTTEAKASCLCEYLDQLDKTYGHYVILNARKVAEACHQRWPPACASPN